MAEQVSSLKTGIKYKDTPIGKIPVDWEVISLRDVSKINMGQSPPSEDCNEKEEGLPFYQGNAEFGSKYPNPKKWCEKPKKIADEGDILISVRAPVGEINIAPHKCCIGRGLAAITAKSIHSQFLYHLLFLRRKYLQKISQGSTFEAINSKELSALLIFLPAVTEQKKIAEILTTLDEAIEKTEQIIEKSKETKKGLMQRLLTRGIGHKEFKKTEIGEIPIEWEVVKLKDVAASQKYSFVDGPFGSNLKSIHYTKQGIPVIQSQSIISGVFKPAEEFYVSEQKARELERSKVLPGDIVIAKIGVNYGASGTIPKNYPPAVLSGNTMKITPDPDKVTTEFLQYLLHYFRVIKVFDKIVSTTAQPAITLEGTRKIMIPLPPLPEQKQIAGILSSVDQEIEEETGHREQLELLKKGLMQVLLTGKIRVIV